MQQVDQVRVGRELAAHLASSGLPLAPVVRLAMIVSHTAEELRTAKVSVVPGLPISERVSRGSFRNNYQFDVALQRAVSTSTDDSGAVRDVEWAQVSGLLDCARAIMMALWRFDDVLAVDPVASGAGEHISQGIWTGVFRVQIAGEVASC
jgi:hypothetical protein